MFNFFRKQIGIKEIDYIFLIAIVNALPDKYSYLIRQVSKDFILNKKRNDLSDEGSYTLTLNADLESKYSNPNLPSFFIIKDIDIWNNEKQKYEQIELDILEGMLAGFKIISNYEELDLSKIDVSRIKEKLFSNEDKDKVKKILGKLSEGQVNQLDINGTFKIQIPEGDFYVIKDLGNGDYISIDEMGVVYKMAHDPYLIDKIFNKEEFLENLGSQKINFLNYFKH